MAPTPIEVKKATPAAAQTASRARAEHPWNSFRSEMDRLFDRFSGAFAVPSLRRVFDWEPATYSSSFTFDAPSVDVAEDEKAYKITAEVPGLEQKDLEVSVTGDMLVLKGEKRQESEKQDKNYHVSERAYGSFQRSFMLPETVDRDKIAAELAKGVLTITLPKAAAAQKPAHKIEVKAAA